MSKKKFSPKLPALKTTKRNSKAWNLSEFREYMHTIGYSKQSSRVAQGKIFLFICWYEQKYKQGFEIACLSQKLLSAYKDYLARYSKTEKISRRHYLAMYLSFLYRKHYLIPCIYFRSTKPALQPYLV